MGFRLGREPGDRTSICLVSPENTHQSVSHPHPVSTVESGCVLLLTVVLSRMSHLCSVCGLKTLCLLSTASLSSSLSLHLFVPPPPSFSIGALFSPGLSPSPSSSSLDQPLKPKPRRPNRENIKKKNNSFCLSYFRGSDDSAAVFPVVLQEFFFFFGSLCTYASLCHCIRHVLKALHAL